MWWNRHICKGSLEPGWGHAGYFKEQRWFLRQVPPSIGSTASLLNINQKCGFSSLEGFRIHILRMLWTTSKAALETCCSHHVRERLLRLAVVWGLPSSAVVSVSKEGAVISGGNKDLLNVNCEDGVRCWICFCFESHRRGAMCVCVLKQGSQELNPFVHVDARNPVIEPSLMSTGVCTNRKLEMVATVRFECRNSDGGSGHRGQQLCCKARHLPFGVCFDFFQLLFSYPFLWHEFYFIFLNCWHSKLPQTLKEHTQGAGTIV